MEHWPLLLQGDFMEWIVFLVQRVRAGAVGETVGVRFALNVACCCDIAHAQGLLWERAQLMARGVRPIDFASPIAGWPEPADWPADRHL